MSGPQKSLNGRKRRAPGSTHKGPFWIVDFWRFRAPPMGNAAAVPGKMGLARSKLALQGRVG